MDLKPFLLSKLIDEEFSLDVRAYPVVVLAQLRLGKGNLLRIKKFAELLHNRVVNLEVLGDLVADHVVLGEVEESVFLQQGIFKLIAFDRRNDDVRIDPATAIYGASAIRHFDFAAGSRGSAVSAVAAVVVIVVERNAVVFALNQASAGCVVLGRRERQAGVL